MKDMVVIRYPRTSAVWVLLALGALALPVAAGCVAYRVTWLGADAPFQAGDVVGIVSLVFLLLGGWVLRMVTVSVRADADGVRVRTWLRRRSVPWSDVADVQHLVKTHRNGQTYRVVLRRRDGRTVTLPLPQGASGHTSYQERYEKDLAALRELHRRHGAPVADHPVVVTSRTAGRAWKGLLALGVALLAGSALAAAFVPATSAHLREWQAAVPCPAGQFDRECLSTEQALVERTDPARGKGQSWLYFTDDRPAHRTSVDRDAANAFRPGDKVTLTLWRGAVYRVTGPRHEWTEHFATGGEVAVVSALLALGAGVPGSQLLIRRRARRQPADMVVPSVWPFVGVLAGTGVWLLPYVHTLTTDPFLSGEALRWSVPGVPVSVALFWWAWRATRISRPAVPVTAAVAAAPLTGSTFVAARFLDVTDYNPHRFGTHVVLGDGPPAVLPHSGPGRFAAREIPVSRLSVGEIRRARGEEGDLVPRGWEVAELSDAGRPVRLAASPDDLRLVLRELTTPAGRSGS
ncbi:PH domain-containing protein [Streptomyces sp. NPDC006645]|uniref:PH domain-containing protein n=1 Tax=unclassified Streptomyces TaxID=2593676 RepID=UPI0033A2DF3B